MFFIRIGNIMAWLLVILGVFKAITGIIIAYGSESAVTRIAWTRRYFATENTGEVIDSGIYIFATGIVLGLVVEIAKNPRSAK